MIIHKPDFRAILSHKWPRFVQFASIMAILGAIGISALFAIPAKQAGLPDYPAFNEIPDSSLNADMDTVYDLALATPVLDGNLLSLPKFFAMPVKKGVITSSLNNFVTFSAMCDSPVYASAEGIVQAVGSPSDWNDGFGGYIKIKHLDKNVLTIYAHTSSNELEEGDIVQKGDLIAKVGRSGNSNDNLDNLGCNLQFGVLGAVNPFLK